MKKLVLLIPLFFVLSCSEDIPSPHEVCFFRINPKNYAQVNDQSLLLDESALTTQFGNTLEALIILQKEALNQAIEANRIVVPENPTESDLEMISIVLMQDGFLDQIRYTQLVTSVSNDLQTLSTLLSQNELENLIYLHALRAIGFSPSGVAGILPCYDDYEANIALAGIAYGTCLVFSGGIPGAGLCTLFFGAAVQVIEDKFETCLQNTYPNGSSG